MAKQPRKPRQQRAKATVEAIINAALLEMAERGMVAATAQHIADRAGVGIGSFYEYFPNKEAAYSEVFNRLSEMTITLIQELTPQMVKLEMRDAIRLLLYQVGDMLREKDGTYLRCVQQGLRSDLPIDRQPVERALTDLAMQYLMNHPQYMRGRDIPVAIYIFIHGGMQAFIHHMSESSPPISYQQLVDGLANMVAHYAERELQILESDE